MSDCLYTSTSPVSSPRSLPITYSCEVELPKPYSASYSPALTRKYVPKYSHIGHCDARIKVEDEISIDYEAPQVGLSDGDRESKSIHRASADIRLLPPTKQKRGRTKLASGVVDEKIVTGQTTTRLMIPGSDDAFWEEIQKPDIKHNVSQPIHLAKVTKAKLVRIDVDNIRIRNMTPDSEWGTSDADGSSAPLQTSVSVSSTEQTDSRVTSIGGQRTRNFSRPREKQRDSAESRVSGLNGIAHGLRLVDQVIDEPPLVVKSRRHSSGTIDSTIDTQEQARNLDATEMEFLFQKVTENIVRTRSSPIASRKSLLKCYLPGGRSTNSNPGVVSRSQSLIGPPPQGRLPIPIIRGNSNGNHHRTQSWRSLSVSSLSSYHRAVPERRSEDNRSSQTLKSGGVEKRQSLK